MAITWADIKLITMQKLFSAIGNTIPQDASTRDYIAAMPGAANEGLALLATAGKFIVKTIDIAHNPIKNLLTDGKHIHSQECGTMEFQTIGARSLYFEYYGSGTYTVTVGDTEFHTDELISSTGYVPIRLLINNPDKLQVKVTFDSVYPLAIKNMALYSATFPTVNDIPTYAEKVRYPLREMVNDFYMLSTEDIYYEGDVDISRYMRTSDFFQEGDTVLVLDRDVPGNYRVYYKAYPQNITQETGDDEILSIDPEVAPLLCLYMASQLYKEDDNSIATTYRNEFEVGFERLKDRASTPSAERFTSESGWI